MERWRNTGSSTSGSLAASRIAIGRRSLATRPAKPWPRFIENLLSLARLTEACTASWSPSQRTISAVSTEAVVSIITRKRRDRKVLRSPPSSSAAAEMRSSAASVRLRIAL